MNSARDRAENIIDDLQAFLNQQQSRDDSLASPSSDLDLSHSYSSNRTELHMSMVNGHSPTREAEPWDSFLLPAFLPGADSTASFAEVGTIEDQSNLAGSSEVLMTSGSDFTLQESEVFSATLDIKKYGPSQEDDIRRNGGETVVGVQGKTKDDLKMKHASHIDSDSKTSTSSPGLSSSLSSASSLDDVRKEGVSSAAQSSQPTPAKSTPAVLKPANMQTVSIGQTVAETSEVELDKPKPVNYGEILQSTVPPNPPHEVRDSAVMPFPMIFRRSKKDPGSKQYNALVKELEQVLVKRNKLRRSHSMRDDLELEDVPEVVGTLRGTKKLSSSTDNLSVFSNKALLNRLESHFKNRGMAPPTQGKMPAGTSDEKGMDVAGVLVSGHVSKTVMHSSSAVSQFGSSSLVNGHGHASVSSENGVKMGNGLHGTESSISVIKVSANSTDSRPGRTHLPAQTHGVRGSISPPPHSPQEQDSFSQDMSFGSEEDFPLNTSTLPTYGHHYKKHHAVRAGHSHLHQCRTNPDVVYKSQTLDSNFRHITRIAVSKSLDSLPGSFSKHHHHHHEQNSQDASGRWTLERQGSVPMKTIVEHFSETDADEVSAWNTAIKSSKKHKEKGIYRSISQRMVQKIYRFVRPKSTGSTTILRASSFSHSTASKSARATQSSADTSTQERSRLHGNGGNFVVELPNQGKLHSVMSAPSAMSGSDASTGSLRKEVSGHHVHSQPSAPGASLTVQLPNNHKASIVPASLQPVHVSGSTISIGAKSDLSIAQSRSVSRTHSMGSNSDLQAKRLVHSRAGLSHNTSFQSQSVQSVHSGGLTVQLPNDHKASIIPSLPVYVSTNKNGTPLVSVSPQKRSAKVTRSSSYRQTYRPAEEGKI